MVNEGKWVLVRKIIGVREDMSRVLMCEWGPDTCEIREKESSPYTLTIYTKDIVRERVARRYRDVEDRK